MAADLYVILRHRQCLTACNTQLFTDDVDARDHLGHGVLDLQTRVHLDEVELAVLVQEFERPGAAIAHFEAGINAARADCVALFVSDARRRRFLDHFLMAALHGAVSFAEVDSITVRVGQQLEFDVAWLFEKFLHVDHVVAERGARLGLGHRDCRRQRGFRVHDAHAATTAAARRLDNDRVADVAGDAQVFVRVVAERTVGTRYAGHAGGLHGPDGGNLVAHEANRVGFGADEREARRFDALREIRILGKEAVAGMDTGCIGDLGRADDGGHVEVAVYRLRRADADGFVSEQYVLEIGVSRRMHRDCLDTHLAAGAHYAKRDLATIGNYDFIQHVGMRIDFTTPATSASIWFIIFMASMMHRVSPSLTRSPTWT